MRLLVYLLAWECSKRHQTVLLSARYLRFFFRQMVNTRMSTVAYLPPPFIALLFVNSSSTNTRDDRRARVGGLCHWEGQEVLLFDDGQLGLHGRYSVFAADSTVAMNRGSVHRKRPDRLRCPPSVLFSGYRSVGETAESEADPSPPFGA